MSKDPLNILLVVGDYYRHIADELIAGASEVIKAYGSNFDIVRAPGVLEIPAIIAAAERSGHKPTGRNFDGYVALGCVIRGETSHYVHVCTESARAIMDMTVQGLAIGNGILTVENEAQALARASRTQKNKGKEAAVAAITDIEIKKRLDKGGV